jgi:hypothetical protein
MAGYIIVVHTRFYSFLRDFSGNQVVRATYSMRDRKTDSSNSHLGGIT